MDAGCRARAPKGPPAGAISSWGQGNQTVTTPTQPGSSTVYVIGSPWRRPQGGSNVPTTNPPDRSTAPGPYPGLYRRLLLLSPLSDPRARCLWFSAGIIVGFSAEGWGHLQLVGPAAASNINNKQLQPLQPAATSTTRKPGSTTPASNKRRSSQGAAVSVSGETRRRSSDRRRREGARSEFARGPSPRAHRAGGPGDHPDHRARGRLVARPSTTGGSPGGPPPPPPRGSGGFGGAAGKHTGMGAFDGFVGTAGRKTPRCQHIRGASTTAAYRRGNCRAGGRLGGSEACGLAADRPDRP